MVHHLETKKAAGNNCILQNDVPVYVRTICMRMSHLSFAGARLAVVDDDRVVVGAADQLQAVGTEVHTVDPLRVLAEQLGHREATHDRVVQLHRRSASGSGQPADEKQESNVSVHLDHPCLHYCRDKGSGDWPLFC